MTNVASNHSRNTTAANAAGPSILGIWRIGEMVHESQTAKLSLAQPADSEGNPRWDYAIKRALGDENDLEGRRQIGQFIAAASSIAHPNLVAVLDASPTAASPYLVMPRLEGQSMQWHLEADAATPLPVALWLVREYLLSGFW